MTIKDVPSPMDRDAKSGTVSGWLGKPAREVPELAKKASHCIDQVELTVLIMKGESDFIVGTQ
jgi:hypothetical protein